jgi:2-haloacid dehalogenase
MNDLQDIQALVFDVFGTVVDWCGGVAREAKAMLAPKGYALDWTAFAHRWRAEYQPAMEAVRTGARPFVVLDTLHREMLAPVLANYGVRDLGESEITELSHAWRKLDPWPDVREGLARLRRRFVIAPMSNANVALMVAMSKRGGLAWDLVLGAEIAQAYKPLPAAPSRLPAGAAPAGAGAGAGDDGRSPCVRPDERRRRGAGDRPCPPSAGIRVRRPVQGAPGGGALRSLCRQLR